MSALDPGRNLRETKSHAQISGDVASRQAYADELGNLWYRRTAANFNPLMATAAEVTIAEAGEIVAVGELEPESIGTQHLYVDCLVQSGSDGYE